MPLSALLLALTFAAQAEPEAEPGGRSTIHIVSKKTQPEAAAPENSGWTSTSPPSRTIVPRLPAPTIAQPTAIATRPSVDLAVPSGPKRTPAVDLVGRAPPSEGPRIVPWIALGGSALAGIIGAVFASKTLTAVDELGELEAEVKGSKLTLPDEFKDQQKAVFTNGLAATLLLSTALAGAIASTVVLTAD